jgi:RNA polymerase sigma-70 factor (ECF subfamily)
MSQSDPLEVSSRLRQLLASHEKALVSYARRLLSGDEEAARDAVQETFLRYLRDPELGRVERPEAWLYKVCRNVALDRFRKEQRIPPLRESAIQATPDAGNSPDQVLENHETSRAIIQAMANLPSRQQEVLRLKFLGGLSYREISEVTGNSISNVGFIIHQSLRALRSALAPSSTPEIHL